jgi:hypothetical protein
VAPPLASSITVTTTDPTAASKPSKLNRTPKRWIVFDTSALLGPNLKDMIPLLEEVAAVHVLCVPFKALDEIDGWTKARDVDKRDQKHQAVRIRNWIREMLERGSPNVQVQKRSEVVLSFERQVQNNDDMILGYAVYLNSMARVDGRLVWFVTEDKMLQIKAHAEHLVVKNVAQLQIALQSPAIVDSRPASSTTNHMD